MGRRWRRRILMGAGGAVASELLGKHVRRDLGENNGVIEGGELGSEVTYERRHSGRRGWGVVRREVE